MPQGVAIGHTPIMRRARLHTAYRGKRPPNAIHLPTMPPAVHPNASNAREVLLPT